MIGFLKLCTVSFSVVVVCAFLGACIANFLALNPKNPPEKQDFFEDCVFRCALACQWSLVFAAVSALLWLTALCFDAMVFL